MKPQIQLHVVHAWRSSSSHLLLQKPCSNGTSVQGSSQQTGVTQDRTFHHLSRHLPFSVHRACLPAPLPSTLERPTEWLESDRKSSSSTLIRSCQRLSSYHTRFLQQPSALPDRLPWKKNSDFKTYTTCKQRMQAVHVPHVEGCCHMEQKALQSKATEEQEHGIEDILRLSNASMHKKFLKSTRLCAVLNHRQLKELPGHLYLRVRLQPLLILAHALPSHGSACPSSRLL